MQYVKRDTLVIILCVILVSLWVTHAVGGQYTQSAHGNSGYGVYRSDTASRGYVRGNCAHCHEQHASIDGVEPSPVDGNPSPYALFTAPFTSQLDNFCFNCHTGSGSEQSGGYIVNRSYSYRAGGWTGDSLNDIKEAFSFTSPGTSHNLNDILNFISGRWGYNDYSNPCTGCHNPHAVQGDPANNPNGTKTSILSQRGWPIARPSQHNVGNWPLWGDDAAERMSHYTGSYQAPYRYGTSTYEPDGSTITDGSNLTDFVTFCTDCHSPSNTIYSSTLGRELKKINWNSEKHGLASADGAIDVNAPYSSTLGKVLSCTDCHEPHGSPNNFLIRPMVNGQLLSGIVDESLATKAMGYLCRNCHKDDAAATGGSANRWEYAHHQSSDYPYVQKRCGYCHGMGPGKSIRCSNCHYHGSVDSSRTGRVTF